MIFQNFQANFSQPVAMFLEARENAKRVGDEIAAELGGIGRAGRLLLWRALQNATRLACRLSLVIDCESAASEDLNEDENRADF